MITEILQSYIAERFKNDDRYREGHLRVINALPTRRVMGLHIPEMKYIAKKLFEEQEDIIERFENEQPDKLTYEETVVWGLIINKKKSSAKDKFAMLERYVPVMDNWAVCDTFCSNAKWMARTDKKELWMFLQKWFSSAREFEVRFAVVVAMCYFINDEWLDVVFDRLDSIYFDRIKSEYVTRKGKPANVQQGTVQGKEPYYVRMAVAWLLATALAKYKEQTRRYVLRSLLPDDVKALYIRKAKESFRTRNISPL